MKTFLLYLFLFLLCSGSTFSQNKQISKHQRSETEAKEIVQNVLNTSPILDGHNDLLRYFYECKGCPRDLDGYPLDTITVGNTDIIRWKQGGVGAQLLNVFGDEYTARNLLDAYDLVYRMTEKYSEDLVFAPSSAEIKVAFKNHKIAIIPAMEFSIRLENSPAMIRIFHKLGLRAITLAYQTNDIADGSDDTPKHNGLSVLGKEMVKEMNRTGVMIDISHVSEKTMMDVLDISSAPVIFSHSNVKALCNVNRNVSDTILKRLKQNNGIIMLTFVPYFTTNQFNKWTIDADSTYSKAIKEYPEDKIKFNEMLDNWEKENPKPIVSIADMADHFDYVKKLIGVDHIGIGSDFDGILDYITGLEDVSKYPVLLIELAKRGWTETELKKITGENFLRVFESVEQVALKLQKESNPSLIKFK
ncbi:MAG: dipeptidase [Aquaticitalea sp.]